MRAFIAVFLILFFQSNIALADWQLPKGMEWSMPAGNCDVHNENAFLKGCYYRRSGELVNSGLVFFRTCRGKRELQPFLSVNYDEHTVFFDIDTDGLALAPVPTPPDVSWDEGITVSPETSYKQVEDWSGRCSWLEGEPA